VNETSQKATPGKVGRKELSEDLKRKQWACRIAPENFSYLSELHQSEFPALSMGQLMDKVIARIREVGLS